jgi:hypothetical protein
VVATRKLESAGRSSEEECLAPIDARHANAEAAEFFAHFFTAKNAHNVDTTMSFISAELSMYVDATLGWELNGCDAAREIGAQNISSWRTARSYPTCILGDIRDGNGSVMLAFTETAERAGGERRILGAIDIRHGTIFRWASYWDSASVNGRLYAGLKRSAPPIPHALRAIEAIASRRIREVSGRLVDLLSRGEAGGASELFSEDAVYEDQSLNTKITGKAAIARYFSRVGGTSPLGRRATLGHVVGGDLGGGFEWAAPQSSPVATGASALRLDTAGRIVHATIVYDSRDLPDLHRTALASLALDPLR